MWARVFFVLVTIFFVLMNVLLWRAEISGRNKPGGEVPLAAVWEKITLAPDDSSLEIRYRGKKVGYCTWAPNIGEAFATGKRMSEDVPPEGMIKQVAGYTLDLDGTLTSREVAGIRFSLNLKLDTNHVWRTAYVKLSFRSNSYILEADATDEKVVLTFDDDDQPTKRTLTFEEARDPQKLIAEIGGPIVGQLVKTMGLPISLGQTNTAGLGLGLKWQARHDWMRIGHSRLRVYRVEAQLLERFKIVVIVSRVGEILRVELPDQMVLVNDALLSL